MEKVYPVISALSDSVTVIEKNGLKVIRVSHQKASAEVALHGAHVLSYIPSGQKDLIWVSEKSEFSHSTAIRGGIPICWPWFGKVAQPGHGFARLSEWQLVEHRENDEGVVLCLGLEDNAETMALWPNSFQLRLYVEISERLKVTLNIYNTDSKAWHFSGALHSYLNIADIRKTITTGMGPVYADSLQGGELCQGQDELQLTDTIDRVYTQPEAVINVSDPDNQRVICVENNGHNSAVLWNPWAQGAQSMKDMDDEGYNTMLCVESTYHAKSIESGKELLPDEHYQISTEIYIPAK